MSLRSKIMVFMMLVSVASSFISIFVAVFVSRVVVSDSTSQVQSLLLTTVRKDIEFQLKEIFTPIIEYAGLGALAPYIMGVNDEDGISKLSYTVRNAYSALSSSAFEEIFVILEDGRTVSKSGLSNIQFSSEIIENILKKEFPIDFYMPFEYNGKKMIAIFAPLKDFNDNTIGVFCWIKRYVFFAKAYNRTKNRKVRISSYCL